MRLGLACLLSVAALAAAGCAQSHAPALTPGSIAESSRSGGDRLRGGASTTPFKHVIVVMQENRTVDNLFNGFPGADTVRTGMRNGKPFALHAIALEPSINPEHSHVGFVTDYDNGKMDGFDHQYGYINSTDTAYSYVRQPDVQNYWTLATRFTLADEVFQMNMGPSFAAHVNLVAAEGGYPYAFAANAGKIMGPPGCLGTSKILYVDMRTAFPGVESKGPACLDMQTAFDLLDAAGIGWRYYAPNYGIGQHFWSAPDYITHIAEGSDLQYLISPEYTILADIANHVLQPVSWVAPQMCTSDHPHPAYPDELAGPHWVAAITNAIGASDYWKDTLILVVWDDWGGWYDHEPPTILNADQLGFRTPLLIVSAYPVSAGTPDHTIRSQASIITAIENIFNLPSLGQLDAQTDDLSTDFNFSKTVGYGKPLPAASPPPSCFTGSDDTDD